LNFRGTGHDRNSNCTRLRRQTNKPTKKNTRLVQLQFGPMNLCTNHTTSPTTILAYKLYPHLPVFFKSFKSFISVTPYYAGRRRTPPCTRGLGHKDSYHKVGRPTQTSEMRLIPALITMKYIGGRLCGELTRRQQASPVLQVTPGKFPGMEHSSSWHTVKGTGTPSGPLHISPSSPAAASHI
jgi:hypothetical protein